MGLRLGLVNGTLTALSVDRVARPGSAKAADLLAALALPFPSFLVCSTCSCALLGGASAELMPSLPRFMMLAGVTGVIAEAEAVVLDGTVMTGDVSSEPGWDGFVGGGIGGSSIGEGESPAMSMPINGRASPLNSGVELAEREPRIEDCFGWELAPCRIAAWKVDWRLREGLGTDVSSSPLDEAPLRLRPAALPSWSCVVCALELLNGPSQGLVNGEMSL